MQQSHQRVAQCKQSGPTSERPVIVIPRIKLLHSFATWPACTKTCTQSARGYFVHHVRLARASPHRTGAYVTTVDNVLAHGCQDDLGGGKVSLAVHVAHPTTTLA